MEYTLLSSFEVRIGDLVEHRSGSIMEICKTIPELHKGRPPESFLTAYEWYKEPYDVMKSHQPVDESYSNNWRFYKRFDERTVEERIRFYQWHLSQYDTFKDFEEDPTGLFHLIQGDPTAVKGSMPYEGLVIVLSEAQACIEELTSRLTSLEK